MYFFVVLQNTCLLQFMVQITTFSLILQRKIYVQVKNCQSLLNSSAILTCAHFPGRVWVTSSVQDCTILTVWTVCNDDDKVNGRETWQSYHIMRHCLNTEVLRRISAVIFWTSISICLPIHEVRQVSGKQVNQRGHKACTYLFHENMPNHACSPRRDLRVSDCNFLNMFACWAKAVFLDNRHLNTYWVTKFWLHPIYKEGLYYYRLIYKEG